MNYPDHWLDAVEGKEILLDRLFNLGALRAPPDYMYWCETHESVADSEDACWTYLISPDVGCCVIHKYFRERR